jgi:hypothetical protein
MLQKLINKVLEYYSIGGALEYAREYDPILAIYGQYLVSLVAMEVGYLPTRLYHGYYYRHHSFC